MPGSYLFLLAFLGALPSLDERPARLSEKDWQIQVELTAVIVPEKLAFEILDETPDEAGAKAGWAMAMAAVDRGTGAVAGTQRVTSEHGATTSADSGEELRYPSFFELPTFPNFDKAGEIRALPKDLKVFELPPGKFETATLGVSLEATAEVSPDGQWLRIGGQLTHRRLAGWDEISGGVTPAGAKIVGKQPRISVLRTTGSYYLRAGARTLAGAHKLPDPKKPEMELFFLRATTVRKPATPISRAPVPIPPAAAPTTPPSPVPGL